MKSRTTWLRVSYWVGAIADGMFAVLMLSQAIFAQPSAITGYVPEIPYRYAMGLAGSLMLAWTLLLLWADRSPVARRGILLITNVVILGLMASTLFAASVAFIPVSAAVPMAVFQLGLLVLFTSSYVASKTTEDPIEVTKLPSRENTDADQPHP